MPRARKSIKKKTKEYKVDMKNTTNSQSEINATIIEKDLQWLHTIVIKRIKEYLDPNKYIYEEPIAPDIDQSNTFYTKFIQKYELNLDERKILLLALAPEIKPEMLDEFLINNKNSEKYFTIFGGISSPTYRQNRSTIHPPVFVALRYSITE